MKGTDMTSLEKGQLADRDEWLDRARACAAVARDEEAKQAYLQVLRRDPTHLAALHELAALANATGHRSAARTAYRQALRHHPGDAIAHVGLGNILADEEDAPAAREHYQAALAASPGCPEAHQGLARLLPLTPESAASQHWQQGFADHAVVRQWYRGTAPGVQLLLLVSARGGNMPTRQWLDDRIFAVTAIHADFHDPAQPLPPHALVVNAIGDADLCDEALRRAEAIVARCSAPVINPPALVRETGRAANATRLAGLPGVIVPRIVTAHRAELDRADLTFPLLLRAPGFHTGQHFVYVDRHQDLAAAAATMPDDTVLAIEYLDARGRDLMARKYRVMFIDGVCYPLHLAISGDWKVHYFSAAMATNAAYRSEEQRFLDDMPAVLGETAMAALGAICKRLGLDYAGIDFALSPDGSVMVFEANATMVIIPPDPEPVWDYRRPAIDAVLRAARQMLLRRCEAAPRVAAGETAPQVTAWASCPLGTADETAPYVTTGAAPAIIMAD